MAKKTLRTIAEDLYYAAGIAHEFLDVIGSHGILPDTRSTVMKHLTKATKAWEDWDYAHPVKEEK